MKKLIVIFMLVLFLFSLPGCRVFNIELSPDFHKYSFEFLGTFDTMIQFIGYAKDEEEFGAFCRKVQERFEELNKLYDIYNNYDGINNIRTINDNAGIKPVAVSQDVIDLIEFAKEWYNKTGGKVNIALGPVLSIWHTYRDEGIANPSKAEPPPVDLLKKAYRKTDINKVEIDHNKKTIFLQEAGMSLDVGAIAKGFATEIAARELERDGCKSFIISSGGNVRAVGKPADGTRNKWGIGIQNPDGNPLESDNPPLDTVYITDTSVVTSGDYQRYYTVNGVRYNHIIDPETLMPANNYRAVTIITQDSGVADFLSTTAFILPYEKSRALIESIKGAAALWIMPDGEARTTGNMKKLLKSIGGATNK